VSGGFICGKYVTTDEHAKELRFAPHAPFVDRPLPYDYVLNLTPGTPLYRRLPLRAERKENERTLALGKGKKASDVAKRLQENGEEVPAYLKDLDSAKPHASFDELKGESGGLVITRMLRGFYLSVDTKVEGFAGTFWRTTEGFFAPKDHVILHEGKTEFEGIELTKEGENRKLPLAWVVGTRARKCDVDLAEKKVERHDKLDRFTTWHLTSKHETIDNRVYWETDAGFWLRDIDIAVARPAKPPADIAAGEKWIDVDLLRQSLTAYEGDKPIFTTIVSTGRHDADPAKDHRTVEGTFRIREKHVSTTMDDDAASDGTYRIEDVPWVMYFEKSVALHGAFWHSMFGRERSHGCVNLQPADAKRLFDWAGPTIPPGWHGVRATKENPGTRVVTHR
jgi:lipoprotein-anchoring transpeptidase ErfK/SrfK